MSEKGSDNHHVTLALPIESELLVKAVEAASGAGMSLAGWIARALQRAVESEVRGARIRDALGKGECLMCGYAPCACYQQ